MRSIIAVSLFSLMSIVANARTPFLPVDEARKDLTFAAYRAQLQQIVADKDHKALLEHVDENIEFSFNEDIGKEGFIRHWNLAADKASASGLWEQLENVLRLGGSFMENGDFQAPYVTSNWPQGSDYFDYSAVIGSGVRVRAQPNSSSDILYLATFEILRAEFSFAKWRTVVTPDGQAGYVWHNYIRSAIDYRAFFHKVNGVWLMKVFIAGD